MESILPQVRSTSELAPGHEGSATPFSQQTIVLTKQAYIQLKGGAHYWGRKHARLVEREVALKAEVEALQATIRDLSQRLYGAKSEKSAGPDDADASTASRPRHRGQQPDSQGHGRSDRSALLVVPEVHALSPAQACCPTCGEAFAPFRGAEEPPIIKLRARPHLRRIKRR